MPAPSYTVDLGYAVLIVLGMTDLVYGYPGNAYGTATMAFLAAELTTHSNDVCLIAAHAPLMGTVRASGPEGGGDSRTWWNAAMGESSLSGAPPYNDAEVRAVLEDHNCAKAWISGHTHSPVFAPDIVKAETVGGHTMAMINTSSFLQWGAQPVGAPVVTAWVTVVDDEKIETRWRNHSSHQWIGSGTNRELVATVTL